MICPSCQRDIADNSNFCYLCGQRQAAPAQGGAPAAVPVHKEKRLMRSVTDVKIAGVCAGVADYFDVDPTVVRLIWVLLVIFPVPFVPAFLGYLIAWMIMPKALLPLPATVPAGEPATRPV
jgi:phage shock protein C